MNIVEIYRKMGVVLQQSGDKWRGNCPFHTESAPSFFVYPDGSYYCFGCHKYGSYDSVLEHVGSDQKFLPDFLGTDEKDPLRKAYKKLEAHMQVKLADVPIKKRCKAYDELDRLMLHIRHLARDADIERLELLYHLKREYAKIISSVT